MAMVGAGDEVERGLFRNEGRSAVRPYGVGEDDFFSIYLRSSADSIIYCDFETSGLRDN